MMTIAAALLFAVQDEGRLKESWPKLVDAWKTVEAYKAQPARAELDDEYIKLMGRLHDAFEAGGLYDAGGEYAPLAVKAFVKARARGLAPSNAGMLDFRAKVAFVRRAGQGGEVVSGDPMTTFLESIKKLRELKKSGLDDDDNVQDELATARKALKALGITSDGTLAPLRRRALALVRALALDEGYPEPPKATEEQGKQIREWIGELGHEAIESRDKATQELIRAGEAALPFVREALKSADAEVVARARRLLGVGHAPWTEAKSQEGHDTIWTIDVPMAVPADPGPKKK
jgi:hypothetical protein